MSNLEPISELRSIVMSASPPLPQDAGDYRIAAAVRGIFVAKNRSNVLTALVPLPVVCATVSRRGSGFALLAAERVAFSFEGRRWEQPAAILECIDTQLTDAFLVLVADIARRIAAMEVETNWGHVVAWVEEWQMLLGRHNLLTAEGELGLWGELWVLSNSTNPDSLLQGWRGPDQEPVDFFYNGLGLEIKASRRPHVHHVSQRQVEQPVGVHESFLLSLWVGLDPVRGTSLQELVGSTLLRISDTPSFVKRLAGVGYSLIDARQYTKRFVLLERPHWFCAVDIPRVRSMDPGVSELRYTITLDVDESLPEDRTRELWTHFCQIEPPF